MWATFRDNAHESTKSRAADHRRKSASHASGTPMNAMSSPSVVIPDSATTVTFTWNGEEHVRAVRAIFRNMLVPSWLKVVGRISLSMLAATLLIGFLGAPRIDLTFMAVLPWLIILALWMLVIWQLSPRLNARAWAKRNTAGDQQITQRFTTDGLETTSHAGSSLTHWHMIKRVIETDAFLLLYFTWQCAVFVPKRALSAEQYAAIRARLAQVLDANALRFRENLPME